MKEFRDLLSSSTNLYVEDQLNHHFSSMIEFVRKAEQQSRGIATWVEGSPIPGYGPKQAVPILNDFKSRWEKVRLRCWVYRRTPWSSA
jgi:hypothetical protein